MKNCPRNWEKGIAANSDRKSGVNEQWEGKMSSSVLCLECLLCIHVDC